MAELEWKLELPEGMEWPEGKWSANIDLDSASIDLDLELFLETGLLISEEVVNNCRKAGGWFTLDTIDGYTVEIFIPQEPT